MGVAGDNLILTADRGYLYFNSLLRNSTIKDNIWYPVKLNLRGFNDSDSLVTACHYKNSSAGMAIVTKLGYSLTLTYDQWLYILNTSINYDWIPVSELSPATWVVIQLDNYPFKTLPYRIDFPSRNLTITLPSPEGTKFAEWLGYFMADGFIIKDKGQFGFNIDQSDDGRIDEYLKELTYDLFGYYQHFKGDSLSVGTYHGIKYNFYYEDESFTQELIDFIGDPNSIPEAIFCGGRETISGFIRGYYTACCEPELTKKIRAFSKSRNFISQLQILLASIGIPSSMTVGYTDTITSRDYIYYLYVVSYRGKKTFKDTVGFFNSRQNDKLTTLEKTWLIPVNYQVEEELYEPVEPLPTTRFLGIKSKSRHKERMATVLDRHYAGTMRKQYLLDTLGKNHLIDQIMSIEHGKIYDVYDLKFEQGDTFLANNFICKVL